MEHIEELVRGRRSVRTYDGKEISRSDLGIALCHFALAAKEAGFDAQFHIGDPGITTGNGVEYIASYLLSR